MKEIYLIRHGKTAGNLEKQYIGRTDQPLCQAGIEEICWKVQQGNYPDCEMLAVSPMLRCIQTAKLIYPEKDGQIFDDLREFDFGDFEGKTYVELKDDPLYNAFLSDGQAGRVPGGESLAEMQQRCCSAFTAILEQMDQTGCQTAAVVCHGGTIMSILDSFCGAEKHYFDYWIENGGIYFCKVDDFTRRLTILKKGDDH